MNKIKTLSILVGILAIINIGLLIFLLLNKPKGPRSGSFGGKERSEKFIKENFKFDDSQMEKFHKSRNAHADKIRDLRHRLNDSSRSFYLLERNKNLLKSDSILTEIKSLNDQIYMVNLKHFDEVRDICKPEQLPEMDHFVNALMNKRGGKRKGKGSRRRR